jgi:hypothetical protein
VQSNDLLKVELRELQKKYKNVLLEAKDKIFKSNTAAIIDEIGVFWQQNKKLVRFFLNNYIEPFSSYVFTAATVLDIEDYEHYPFVLLGQYHIWDDPIYKYVHIIGKTENPQFDDEMKKRVEETISDNLKLLDIAEDIIYILPVKYLSEESMKLAYNAANQAFLSMFKDKFTLEEYRESFNSILEIKDALRPGIEENIFFLEDENISTDFETRFNDYKKVQPLPLPKEVGEAREFYFIMLSYLSQAFDILLMCAEYQVYPYIRFDVAIKYMALLSKNFSIQTGLQDIVYKGLVAHILHQIFNKERIRNMNFNEYCKTLQTANFEVLLFCNLEKRGITARNLNANIIADTIDSLLKSII